MDHVLNNMPTNLILALNPSLHILHTLEKLHSLHSDIF